MAARAEVADLDLRHARLREQSARDLSQVEHSPGREALPERPEGLEDLVADLVAAGADARADSGGRRLDLLHPVLDDPGRHPAPAAMDHRHASRPRQRDREAVGDEDEGREPGPIGRVTVGLREARSGVGERGRLGRLGVGLHQGLMHLTPDQDAARVDLERGGQPVAVLAHPGVAGEAPEVERVEGRLADPADPGAERGHRAGELGLEPAHAVLLRPAQAGAHPPGLTEESGVPACAALSFDTNPLSPSSRVISIRLRTYGCADVASPGTSLVAPR